MSESLLPLTIETSIEDTIETENTYDCWQNESYDSDFYISCAMTMIIFIYINLIDYIAKKYVH